MNLNFDNMYGTYLRRVLCIFFVNSAVLIHMWTELKCLGMKKNGSGPGKNHLDPDCIQDV